LGPSGPETAPRLLLSPLFCLKKWVRVAPAFFSGGNGGSEGRAKVAAAARIWESLIRLHYAGRILGYSVKLLNTLSKIVVIGKTLNRRWTQMHSDGWAWVLVAGGMGLLVFPRGKAGMKTKADSRGLRGDGLPGFSGNGTDWGLRG